VLEGAGRYPFHLGRSRTLPVRLQFREDFFTGKIGSRFSRWGEKLLAKHGVDLRKPVVYYCTGGIRSGYAWMVHTLAGLPNGRNYEGGMEEWKRLHFRETS
jgi:thiosulfate/3-mercaptopyruvate sulfurtransferase